MAKKVVAMETRLQAALTVRLEGVAVTALCAELGISRQTFYKWRRRYESEGLVGLAERSRRPHRSPGMIPVVLEDEIVRLRKTLPLENGAQTIAYHLARSGWEVPSLATIHRALRRRGQVVDQPQKRPRSSWARFEYPDPNGAWQIDATTWHLARDVEVCIMDILDDHSRLITAARACRGPDTDAAWGAFTAAVAAWGPPACLLSDNGSCFTGRFLTQTENTFERNLRLMGVRHILSSPGHPQTCGKIERFHQTLKRWLVRRPLARSLAGLQAQLDEFLVFYNQQRPHRALHGATPHERWHARPPATPGSTIPGSLEVAVRTVNRQGHVHWAHRAIAVGNVHAGQQALVIARGDDITILGRHGLIRQLTIDRTRFYQPSGLPRGHRKKKTGPRQ